jgi:nuclear transport factor 2 (NTF2) superfamily protein
VRRVNAVLDRFLHHGIQRLSKPPIVRTGLGNWFRTYGNQNWEFDEQDLMRVRFASINDLPIKECERGYRWPLGRRSDDYPGLSDL